VTATAGAAGDAGDGRGAAWGDYDNDGDLDLYVANGSGGANRLLGNNGDGTFDDVTVDALGDAGESQGVAWGDYDNDGDLDLYFANWGTGNRLLRNDGGAFTDVTDDVVGNPWDGTGVAWSDYDRDGDLDLYLANHDHDNVLVRNAYPHTFHWLHARLLGVASNASGVGARVRVHAGGSVQIREVGSDAGYGSGNSLTVEFGLGTAVHVDSVVVSWPSGLVDVHRDLAIDQFVTLTEDVPPPAPADVAATPVEAGVEVVWSPVGVPDLDRYWVERDTTDAFGDGTVVFETQDTTHVDFPVLDEDEYFYRVFARDQAHKLSAASDTVSAVPLQTPPPRPFGLSTLGGDLMVTLSWRAVDVPDVEHYRVERDTSIAFGDGMLVSTTTDTFLVDSPLVMGEEYFYRAITVDLSGLTSGPSDTLAYVAHGIPPSVPLRFDVDSEYDVISLLWDESPEPDVVGYVVYRDTVPDLGPADSLAFVASPAYDDTSCPRYGVFWYCVSALDSSGLTSVYSDTAAGLRAPGGATFVDCANTGFQNGSFDYPYRSIQAGVESVSRGGAVIVLPGTCEGDITITTDLVLLGLGGSDVTLIEVPAGVGITAVGLTDSARIEGFTVDGLGMGDEGLYCLDSDLLVTDCVFRNVNVGASFEEGSEPVVAACRFESNNEGVVVADSSSPFFSGNLFTGSVVAGVRTVGSVGPVLGGSLEDANDFTDFSLFAILNTSPVEVSAEYNYWGDDCVLTEWFLGPVDYVPWTDATHTEEYTECPTGVVDDGVPVAYALGRCYPNPFNPVTRIQYDVPSPGGRVVLRVFSASGRLVRTLCDGSVPPGHHVAAWDGRDEAGARVASGVYFCRMEAGRFAERRKLVLLK